MKCLYNILVSPVLTIIVVFVSACTVSDQSGAGSVSPGVVKFHSAENPGIWESKIDEHDAEIMVTLLNDKKIINIQVPFAKKKEKNHYVEAIILLDQNKKEIRKKSFESGYGEEGAQFELQADYNQPLSVVIKCSAHDMWEKPVDLN